MNTHLHVIETVMHHRDEVVGIHRLHFLYGWGDGLECWEPHVKVDVIEMPFIKGIKLQDITGKSYRGTETRVNKPKW